MAHDDSPDRQHLVDELARANRKLKWRRLLALARRVREEGPDPEPNPRPVVRVVR